MLEMFYGEHAEGEPFKRLLLQEIQLQSLRLLLFDLKLGVRIRTKYGATKRFEDIDNTA